MFSRLYQRMIWGALVVGAVALVGEVGYSKGGGGWSAGASIGTVNTNQEDMNALIGHANSGTNGPISTSSFGSAYEFTGYLNYRFSGSIIALSFRPSYYMNSAKGTGTGGKRFDYSLQGFSFFPMFHIYLLENNYVRLFVNAGVGIANMRGDITEDTAHVAFSGTNTGFETGLGVEFCFSANHCVGVEANYRMLDVPRNLATASSGTFDTGNGSLSRWGEGQEVEVGDYDLKTSLTGIIGSLGYIYYF